MRKVIAYDPGSGEFTWLVNLRGHVKAGAKAGSVDGQGYIHIGFEGRKYKAHRVAWLLHNGEWPEFEIDHINRRRTDNRIVNLRCCTRAINMQNKSKQRVNSGIFQSKYVGVTWSSYSNKWLARITVGGKCKYLGVFENEDDAHRAYVKKKDEIHDFKDISYEQPI